jgi:hypothetical protein
MNRRTFLSLLSAGAFGAMTLDVDKLLWTPGAKTIFLPPIKVDGDTYTHMFRRIDQGGDAMFSRVGDMWKRGGVLYTCVNVERAKGLIYMKIRKDGVDWRYPYGLGQ